MITPYNILRHELIGLQAEVIRATDRGYLCSGTIVGESRNTLRLQSDKVKAVPKDCIVLKVELPDGTVVEVDGKLLVARPEDRIKKKYRIRFV